MSRSAASRCSRKIIWSFMSKNSLNFYILGMACCQTDARDVLSRRREKELFHVFSLTQSVYDTNEPQRRFHSVRQLLRHCHFVHYTCSEIAIPFLYKWLSQTLSSLVVSHGLVRKTSCRELCANRGLIDEPSDLEMFSLHFSSCTAKALSLIS